MAAVNSCGFSQFAATKCGVFTAYSNEKKYLRLKDCKKDITGHLRSVNVAVDDVETEWQLIVLRCGIFDFNSPLVKGKIICPAHRYGLGIKWTQPRPCKHPLHGSSKGKPRRGISSKESKEIHLLWNTLVPVGSGKK